MLELIKGAKLMVETCAQIQPGESVLVLVDDEAWPMRMGQVIMDVASSVGAEAVLAVMKPRQVHGHEPPKSVAVAMKSVNAIILMSNRYGICHTNARMEATSAGVRVYTMDEIPEDYFKRDLTVADIHKIRERTEKTAQRLTQATTARVTTPAGTDITMSLSGREGLAIHPLNRVFAGLPDCSEAAISPVEGTAEGIIVVDIGLIGWGYVLRQPLRYTVKLGRVVEISGGEGEDAEKLRKIVATDENANNIAELGIGTSHTIPSGMEATRQGAGMAGTVHIAIGRNNDIGGQTWSHIHVDGLMSHPTVELDGDFVVKDGVLLL